jgi:hypothetical protein
MSVKFHSANICTSIFHIRSIQYLFSETDWEVIINHDDAVIILQTSYTLTNGLVHMLPLFRHLPEWPSLPPLQHVYLQVQRFLR